MEINILTQNEFYDVTFSDLKVEGMEFINKTFENCKFIRVNFSEAKFLSSKFVECDFESCNLSSVKLTNSSFIDIVFTDSKLIGINWTQVKWAYIKLNSPIKFYRSNISYSSFYELELKEIVMDECKAHEVDFREADLSNGSFKSTDFYKSLFMHTKLISANFTDAVNYCINPNENDIRKGKFSLPDVLLLLNSFEIEIDDFGNNDGSNFNKS